MNQKTLGICLIGCGRAGMIHARNFSAKVPFARMEAVVDTQAEAASQAANELGVKKWGTDYRVYLEDDKIDAVVVVAPTNLHCGIVLDAARHGKHIFCEKPMAMNTRECQTMIDACQANGVKLQIGFMRRHDAEFQEAKRLLDSGAIGDLVLIKSHTRGPSKPRPWMYDLKKSNGILAEVNSHDIDAVRWFSGSEVERLFAVGGNYRNEDARAEYPDYYDNVLMSGQLRNGMQFQIDGAAYVQYGYDAAVELLGTKGLLRVGRRDGGALTLTTSEGKNTTHFVDSWRTLFADAYLREDIAFVSSILQDTAPEAGGYDGLQAVAIVEAGNHSIASGHIINL